MISASSALTASNTTTGSLSYINTLVTGATSQGLYELSIPQHFLNENMISDLTNVYGYKVYAKSNSFMGTNNDYVIKWG